MRRILVESARRKNTLKRGGNRVPAKFDLANLADPERPDEVLAVDEALATLAAAAPVLRRPVCSRCREDLEPLHPVSRAAVGVRPGLAAPGDRRNLKQKLEKSDGVGAPIAH
jgi:hypothetical protein